MITLHQTCSACPEQYDAFIAGHQVAYLRLRWGEFRVYVPDVEGEVVYYDEPECCTGEGGDFADHERDDYLRQACRAILDRIGFPWAEVDYQVVHERPEVVA